MDIYEMQKLLEIKNTDMKVHFQQFNNWMNNMFLLNKKLNRNFDPVYLQVFYIVIVELNQTGTKYIHDFVDSNKESETRKLYFETIENGLINLLDDFTKEEKNYILYKRDCSCHIHQTYYEFNYIKGKIKSERKINGEKMNKTDFQEQSFDILFKHGSDEQFDKHFLNVLYPRISGLYDTIKKNCG